MERHKEILVPLQVDEACGLVTVTVLPEPLQCFSMKVPSGKSKVPTVFTGCREVKAQRTVGRM